MVLVLYSTCFKTKLEKRTLFSIRFIPDLYNVIMIEWIIGFLVAKWWADKEEKKECKSSGNIECTIPFGYVRDGESIQDLK
jgi:hypothetical protein